jgi:hypothetical protein
LKELPTAFAPFRPSAYPERGSFAEIAALPEERMRSPLITVAVEASHWSLRSDWLAKFQQIDIDRLSRAMRGRVARISGNAQEIPVID